MSRRRFDRWAAGLSAGDFAQALAGLGSRDQAFDPKTRLLRIHAHPLVSLVHALAHDKDLPPDVPPAAACVKLWQALIAGAKAPQSLARLEIVPLRPAQAEHPAFALDWLARELGRSEVGASSVAVSREAPGLEVGWNWPLRVGVLTGRPSAALRKLLDARPWADLFEMVLADRAQRECDLLLLDAGLRGALSQLLTIPRLTADCTVVLGEAGVGGARIAQLVAGLRSEARTSGVAIADVDADQRSTWLVTLFQEIAHNMPLDVALWRAAAAAKAPQPYFEATPSLLRFARLEETAARISRHLDAAGAAPVAAQIAKAVREGRFLQEGGDATAIARARRTAEAALGAPLRMARRNGDGAPAPAAKPAPEERRVNFDLYDEHAPTERLPSRPLARGRRYRLDISIGFAREEGSADEVLPPLPPSPEGHWLTVAFVPLRRDERGELAEPQTGKVFLPPKGETRAPAVFTFDTMARSGPFDARVIIAYGNRVVQTLLFSAGIGTGTAPRLRAESVAATDLDQLAYRSPVDAALVVNHSPAGLPGATALSGGEITYTELPNMEALVEEIRASLKQLAARKEPFKKLADQELRKHLYQLARHGRSLWRELRPETRRLLADAGALQVIDARPGAYLPVEFFFESGLPGPRRKLCPEVLGFLEDSEAPHKECPHHDDTDFLCPLRFWGFQRVIERQAVYADDENAGKFRLRSPAPARPRIEAFRSALVGTSEKVLKPDQARILDALESHKVKQVTQAKDWAAWCKAVKAKSPSLLVLLPHSDRAVDDEGKKTLEEALELGGDLLALGEFEDKHISGPKSPEPVVFLLGCSTNLTELPFANFVSYARKLNASLVVGTLAPVSGHRAAVFVTEMLKALAAGKNKSFGEAFLAVRRRLLAEGNGFALALVAYGDVDWIV